MFLCCILFALIVVGFGHSRVECTVMLCWCEMPLWGDVPALWRRRVIANWTLPPSGRMRHWVACVNSGRPLTGIVVGIPVLMRLFDVVYSVGLRFFKAVDVGICALCHASTCLFEFVAVSETLFIGMFSFITTRFWFMSPSMYFHHRS